MRLGTTQRQLVIAVIFLLVLMGLPVLTPGMSMSMLRCPACLVVLLLNMSLLPLIISDFWARRAAFAALWHPRPLVPPPRGAFRPTCRGTAPA